MLKLRVREYTPQGVRGKVLSATNITFTDQLNGSATLSFEVSQELAGKLDAPIVVGVEYSFNGSKFQTVPYNNMFVMDNDDGDDLDTARMIKMTGTNYVTWMLAHTYLHWSPSAKNGERIWQSAAGGTVSAGYIMHGMMTESRNRGWGNQLVWNFSGTHDSKNSAWAADEKIKAPWRLLTPLSEVLESLSSDGLCDWRTSGVQLQMYRPDTMSVNRSTLVIGGAGFERTPIRSDASGIFTHLTVVPEKARHWLYLTNPGSVSKFGRLEATMTQSGIASHSEATKLAQPHLRDGKQPIREESFEWTPAENQLAPWHSFNVGDTVLTRARGAKLPRRIVGIVVNQGEDGVATVVAKAGEILKGSAARVTKRLSQLAVGGIVGGTGSGFPSTSGPASSTPEAPVGVAVISNTGQWLEDGSPQSDVEIQWSPVTMNTDGSEATIVEYEVWSRFPEDVLQRDTATNDPKATLSLWEPGLTRLVSVRAKSDEGVWSDYSVPITVVPLVPMSQVPKAPVGLAIVSNTGGFTETGPRANVAIKWDAVTESMDDGSITIAFYRIWLNGALHSEPVGTNGTVVIPSQVSGEFRVSAVSDKGFESDRSTSISATGALPTTFVLVPTAPVLSSSHGNVRAVWNGLYTTAAPPGAHTIRVEARVGTSGAWIMQGAALDKAGEQLVSVGEIGQTVQVRFRAYDQLQRLTGTSAVVSITVAGVGLSDLNEAVNDYLSDIETTALEAHQSADGKNTIHYGNTAPAGTDHIVGDTWFDGANGNRVHRWDGSNWTAAQFGSNAIANLAITNAEIANGTIQNGKIANLDAAKINAGTLNAARIGANTIGAEKLMVADLSNMATVSESVPGTAAYANWTSTVVDGWAARSAITDTYFMFRKQHGPLPFKTGDRIRVTFEAYADAAVNATLTLWTYPAGTGSSNTFPGGNIALTTTPQLFERELTVTAPTEGKNAFLIGLSGVSNRDVRLRNVRAYRMGAGELIVDGAVRAEHIEMDQGFAEKFEASEALFGTIGVDQLKPNIGELISIEGNVVITGLLDPEDGKLAEMEAATSAVSNAVDSVGAIAERADGKALSAYGLAEGVQTALTNHRKVFRVTNGVPEVATLNGLNVLRLEPDRIEMEQGGQIVTYWSNGELVVSNIMASHVKIVNPSNSQGHVIEHDGASGVIINPL